MKTQDPPSPPRVSRREAKVAAILDAAKRVFLSDGFASSVDRIATEAGVSKQTIYAHFGSKEGLLRATADHMKALYVQILDADRPAREVLARFAEALLDRAVSPESVRLQRLLIAQAAQFPDLARLNYEMGLCRSRDLLVGYLDALVASGRMPPADTGEAAEVLIALVQGIYRHRLLLGVGDPPDAAERAAHVARCVARFARLYDLSA